MEIQDRGALTVKQFCHWANVSRNTLYNEANAGRLALTKIGKKTIITTDDARAWLSRLPKSSAAKAA